MTRRAAAALSRAIAGQMSLSQALARRSPVLRVTQAGLSLVAANVANAETPGYVRKTARAGRDRGRRCSAISVRVAGDQPRARPVRAAPVADRELRRRATPTCARSSTTGCRSVYGEPGSDSALETVFNNFTTAVQALSTSPDRLAARSAVRQLRAGAGAAAQQHDRRHPGAAQRCRARAVRRGAPRPTTPCSRSPQINQQLGTAPDNDATTATLIDQRDQYIDQLSQLMDINVIAERPQSGHGLHQFGHSARRHRSRRR